MADLAPRSEGFRTETLLIPPRLEFWLFRDRFAETIGKEVLAFGVHTRMAVEKSVEYFGDVDTNVYALSARNGAKLWNYQTGSSVFSSPTLANEVVYDGSDDGSLYALNARTGAKSWSYATGIS